MNRGKKILFTMIVAGIVLVLLELIGVFAYYVFLPGRSREMIELTLGIERGKDLGTSALHYRPHPYFNYVLNPDYAYSDGGKPYNSHGFRKPEWPSIKKNGTIRIIALGGSTTFGMFATRGDDVWPAMVEKRLRRRFAFPVEVFNLGVPGYTANETLGVLCMLVPELEPDIVLIHCGANDAFAQVYPDEGGADNTRFRFSWSYRPLSRPLRWAMRASRLCRVIGAMVLSYRSYLPGDMFALFQYPHPAGAQALEQSRKAVGKYFKRNLRTMAAVARDLKAIPVLIGHPLNPEWDSPRRPFNQAVTAAHLRCNRICRELGRELQMPVIDLFPLMRDAGMFVDAIHVNSGGMRYKASILARYLEALIAAEWEQSSPPDID